MTVTVTQTQGAVTTTMTLAEFLADKDAVVEWHMLPEPTGPWPEDEWTPEYDDDVDRVVTQTQTPGAAA